MAHVAAALHVNYPRVREAVERSGLRPRLSLNEVALYDRDKATAVARAALEVPRE